MFYIESVDKLLGQTVSYGSVYRSFSSAKRGLSASVAASRKCASKLGYGTVYYHWNDKRTKCKLTHGKDPSSSQWELLMVKKCRPGVPFEEIVD